MRKTVHTCGFGSKSRRWHLWTGRLNSMTDGEPFVPGMFAETEQHREVFEAPRRVQRGSRFELSSTPVWAVWCLNL